MSRTYSLGCDDCEAEIWIGQGNSDRRYIYKDAEHLTLLDGFLFEHETHKLQFYDDEGSDYRTLNLPDRSDE